jgi:4-amino-4-deoxy-L-arabinose transferase-like glycosyltransferase
MTGQQPNTIETARATADAIPPARATRDLVHKKSFLIALLVAFWLAIYLPGLFRPALMDDADTVHAEVAREMLLSHDWVTLHIDLGVRYLEKAPLLYWIVASSYKLFGVSEWSTRLPLTLSVLALGLALFRLGSRIFGLAAGFYSALIITTSFGIYIYTRFLIPEALVALWLTMGFDFFLIGLGQERPSRLACWGLAATAALNVLTKGLIGIVFPAAIIFVYLLLARNLRHLPRMRLFSSLLVFLAIAAPWHVLAAIRNPAAGQSKGFLWFYFVNEHFKRYLGTRYPKDYDTVPLAIFWGLVLVWLVPWSAFLPQAVMNGVKRRRQETSDDQNRALLLCMVWATVILVFFSFSTRQEYYMLPGLPALALLVGAWLQSEDRATESDRMRTSAIISSATLFGIGLLAFAVVLCLLTVARQPAPGADIADLMRNTPSRYSLSFGHLFDLTPQALGAFRGPLLGAGLALLLGTGVNLLTHRRRPFAGNLAMGAMMVVLLWCAQRGLVVYEPILSSKQLALAIARQYKPGDVIVQNGLYEHASSLTFYTGQQAHLLDHVNGNIWYGSLFPDAPKIFENTESLQRLWHSPTRVFLWTHADSALPPLGDEYEIARSGGKIILSNQPAK